MRPERAWKWAAMARRGRIGVERAPMGWACTGRKGEVSSVERRSAGAATGNEWFVGVHPNRWGKTWRGSRGWVALGPDAQGSVRCGTLRQQRMGELSREPERNGCKGLESHGWVMLGQASTGRRGWARNRSATNGQARPPRMGVVRSELGMLVHGMAAEDGHREVSERRTRGQAWLRRMGMGRTGTNRSGRNG